MLHPGCHGDQNGNNGLWDINCGSRALFLEDKQIYEKLNGGCAEFTNGNNFLTDQISFKIYDVMEYFDRKEELKNEMKNSMSVEGQNHIVFAWCHSNHPNSKIEKFMEFFKMLEELHRIYPIEEGDEGPKLFQMMREDLDRIFDTVGALQQNRSRGYSLIIKSSGPKNHENHEEKTLKSRKKYSDVSLEFLTY